MLFSATAPAGEAESNVRGGHPHSRIDSVMAALEQRDIVGVLLCAFYRS